MRKRLQFSPRLYLGESMNAGKLDKMKKTLLKRPLVSSVYLITLAGNPSDQLEIYAAKQLCQRYYLEHPRYVVGIAANYDEAVAVVEQIAKECLKVQGNCRLKEFCYGGPTD